MLLSRRRLLFLKLKGSGHHSISIFSYLFNFAILKNNSLYFISGASGVGKTAVIPYLKSNLPANFEVHDFDEDGVPNGADHTWRLNKTREWIERGSQKVGEHITLIVCGFSNPDEIEPMKKDFPDLEIKTILLDGNADVIEERLRNRNTNPAVKADLERAVGSAEAFIQNNTRFVPTLREICKKHSCSIIDTNNSDPETVAQKITQILLT